MSDGFFQYDYFPFSGSSLVNNPHSIKSALYMQPRDLAFALHIMFRLPVNLRDLLVSDPINLYAIRDEIVENLRIQVISLAARCNSSLVHNLKSTDVKVTKGSQIASRLLDRSALS